MQPLRTVRRLEQTCGPTKVARVGRASQGCEVRGSLLVRPRFDFAFTRGTSLWVTFPPGGSGERADSSLSRVTGYRRSHRREDTTPHYRNFNPHIAVPLKRVDA